MRSEAREAAITRGLQCLAASQLPSGEFPAEITMLWKPGGVTEPDGTPFVTALILRALDVLPASRTDSLAGPALAYLKRERTPGGLWRNWNRDATRDGRRLWQWIPADSDDTACIGGVLRRYGRAGRDHRAVLGGSHDAAGRFYTWLVLRPRLTLDPGYWRPLLRDFSVTRDLLFWFQSVARRQDVDAVVNAHVVWCLGEGPATKRAVAWLAGIIAEAREGGADRWYANGWSLYYGIARCHQSGIPGFTETIAHIASRLTTRCRPDGGFGDSVLHTAIAVSTLSLLDVAPALRRRAADLLLASQRPDGSWPSAPFYYAGERRDTFWGSAALTTAHCIEALYRTRGDD